MSRRHRGGKNDFCGRSNPEGSGTNPQTSDGFSRGKHRGRGGGRGGGPPPGLRGKQIGLYYRDLHKNKKQQPATFSLQPNVTREIENLIDAPRRPRLNEPETPKNKDQSSYSHIQDSKFKTKFLRIISGNIQENLDLAVLTGSILKRDKDLDESLRVELLDKEDSQGYREMLQFRKKLPAHNMRREIVDLVDSHQIILVSGETGCGKTTQVAQFILDHEINKGNGSITSIACTQPRRISAISVAERVAAERGERLGESVGFQIRLEKVLPKLRGSVLFCTTAMLLQFMQSDPALKSYSHIIIDEIHERSTQSDFIMALLKQIVPKRPDLKVILMSATLNSEQFSKYYNYCPIIHIPGFTYPVQEYFLEDVLRFTRFQFPPENLKTTNDYRKYMKKNKASAKKQSEFEDFIAPYARHLESQGKYPEYVTKELKNPNSEKLNLELVDTLVHNICLNKGPGAILIFLPGLADISTMHKLLQNYIRYPRDKFVIFPLHSKMPTVDQKRIFQKPPPEVRKIIIATSIAETSITIEDVVYVIDCGKTKFKSFDIEKNLDALDVQWISTANAKQRKGRAGRVRPGECYHLYTKIRGDTFQQYPLPEILCTRLEEVVLSLKILQLGKAETFLASIMDPPNSKAVELALTLLRTLNALDEDEKLTPLGYHLAQLPLDPRTGKMLLWASLFSCIDPVFSVAASLAFKDAFYCPLGMEHEADSRKRELSMGECSDHIALAQAVKRYEEAERQGWNSVNNLCFRYFLSKNTLKLLVDMKHQFASYLYDMKFLPSSDFRDPRMNKNSSNLALVKAVICAGLFPNIAVIKRVKKFGLAVETPEDGKVKVHPCSVNEKGREFDFPYLTYFVKQRSTAIYLHDTTCVSPHALLLASPNCSYSDAPGNSKTICVTEGIKFECDPEITRVIKDLQNKLNEIFEYKINHPGARNSVMEENVLKAVVTLVSQTKMAHYQPHYSKDSDAESLDDY